MEEDRTHRGGARRRVLSEIRRRGGLARIDLARLTGLSQATVTAATAALLRDGLIERAEAPRAAGGRGRPRAPLKLRGPAHLVAGAKVGRGDISAVVTDFGGEVLSDHTEPLPAARMTPEALADTAARAVRGAADAAGLAFGDLSAVGIGFSGLVDAAAGKVHWSPALDRQGVAMGALLEARLGLPCHIDNDANLVAVAERFYGLGREVDDFLVVTVESGIGLGIVLGGELWRGTRGCGAELGHMKLMPGGAPCRCGASGCLEAYVADYALLRGRPDGGGTEGERIEALHRAAKSGDADAADRFATSHRILGMGLANLLSIFDPALVVLTGARMSQAPIDADALMSEIRTQRVGYDLEPPRLALHDWGDLMWARGAAAHAVDRMAWRDAA